MAYTNAQIEQIVSSQRAYFRAHETLDLNFRIRQLKKLRQAILDRSDALCAALTADLGRSETEGYLCDVGAAVMEIDEILAGIRTWARPETHWSGFVSFPSLITKVYKMPYGVTLIISPFNFPILLSFGVLAAAIAGGNTAVIKASSKSPACTKAMQTLIAETFDPVYCTVIDGGHDVADACLAQRFDKIFYTGSPKVARHVMEEAAKNLTPVALELGGETGNFCVVRKDADLTDAARKIAFFKLCNSGQICININQVAVAQEVAEPFLRELQTAFAQQIGPDALQNPEYPHLITEAAFCKCEALAEACKDRIVYGGGGDRGTLRFQPTVIYPVALTEPIVNSEHFSPLLPVIPFPDAEIDALMEQIADREHGLALYLFTSDIAWAKGVMRRQQYGGGCINEVCVHLMVKGVPFNGTGHSGMGAYHGVWGFREFTHPATVLMGKRHGNLPLRMHPYNGSKNAWKLKLIRLFER